MPTAMRLPEVRRIIVAKAISSAGSWVQITAAGWYVLDQTGSATSVGVLAALAFAPAVVGAPVGGYLADRYDLRRMYVALTLLQAIPAFLISILLWDGGIPIPLLFALVFLGAIPGALVTTTQAKLLLAVCPKSNRSAAIADGAVAYNVSRLVGPLLGSALTATIGPGGAFLVNGLSYLYAAWVAQRAKLRYLAEVVADKKAVATSYLSDVKRGMAISAARVAILAGMLFFGLVAPIQQLMPSLARTHGASPFFIGILLSCLALGGISANPIIRRMLADAGRNSQLIDLGLVIAGPALLLLGLSGSLLSDFALLFVVGMGWECVWVASQSTIQLGIPKDVSGRILGLFYSVVTLGTAAGSIVVGMLIDALGVRTSLAFLGLLVSIFGLISLVRIRRATKRPEQDHAAQADTK